MVMEITWSCDRCDSYMPLVRHELAVTKLLGNSENGVNDASADLCSECVQDLKNWLLTPPADRATVRATNEQE